MKAIYPTTFLLKLLLMIGIGSTVGYLSANYLTAKPPSVNRHPAAWQGKHQRLLETEILAVGGIPLSDNQDLLLKGRVHAIQPIAGEVHYNWILPAGASLVAGELSDSVNSLPDPNKYLELEITVQGVSREDENKVVILQAYSEVNGVRIGNSTAFSTKAEETNLAGQSQHKLDASTNKQPLPSHIQQ